MLISISCSGACKQGIISGLGSKPTSECIGCCVVVGLVKNRREKMLKVSRKLSLACKVSVQEKCCMCSYMTISKLLNTDVPVYSGFRDKTDHFLSYLPRRTTIPKQKQAPPTWLAKEPTYLGYIISILLQTMYHITPYYSRICPSSHDCPMCFHEHGMSFPEHKPLCKNPVICSLAA